MSRGQGTQLEQDGTKGKESQDMHRSLSVDELMMVREQSNGYQTTRAGGY